MKRLVGVLVVLVLVGVFSGSVLANQVLKVGATPVPHAEILEFVKPLLIERGIELEIIEFNDYVQPNLALADGELDANYFQHIPYLETFSHDRGLKLKDLAAVHIEPLGLYSKKVDNVEDLGQGALIAIPNDPTNEGRALLLLQAKGLIQLDPAAGLEATVLDILENEKKLKFKELDAAQLARVLEDVDAAIINTNYALPAGLNPVQDALVIEDSQSPYVNVLAVREADLANPELRVLAEILVSDVVKDFILEKYQGAIVPAPGLRE